MTHQEEVKNLSITSDHIIHAKMLDDDIIGMIINSDIKHTRGITLMEDDFVACVNMNTSILENYPNFRFKKVIDAVKTSDSFHPSCTIHDSEPSWVPYVISALLGIELASTSPRSSPGTDEEILERLCHEGEYVFDNNHVLPREGPQYTLERNNWHARDTRIVFDDIEHAYFLSVNGKFTRFKGSVSSAYGAFFSHFDARECIEKNFTNWLANPNHKSHVITNAVLSCFEHTASGVEALVSILTYLWDRKNRLDAASEKGTKMHLAIEWYMNGTTIEELDPQMLEHGGEITLPIQQFRDFCTHVMKAEGLQPYRTEWSVYDEESMLSGQIDSIMIDREGSLHMIDWKRCKVTNMGPEQPNYRRYGTGPCALVPDNDFGHYSIQQNIYKRLLEKNYGVKVKSMRLAQFHPTALANYRMIIVPEYQNVVDEIMQLRQRELNPNYNARVDDVPTCKRQKCDGLLL